MRRHSKWLASRVQADSSERKVRRTSIPPLVINGRAYGYLEKDQLVEVIDEILEDDLCYFIYDNLFVFFCELFYFF
jgi:hypothetical protein